MSAIISGYELVKVYGIRRVLDHVSVTASPGQRVGLIGENGAGKSTVLGILAGLVEPDAGTVTRPADLGFLHQELPYPGAATVADVLDHALAELRRAEQRLDRLAERLHASPDDPQHLAEYGEVLQWATDHELWDADRRANLVLAGLGVAGAGRDRRLATLAGGERSRLGLATLLIRQPSALLLDEPTNHLDDDAIGFLEAHLSRLPGAVVLASHDRVFLEVVCTDLVDLDPAIGGATHYGGGYRDYLRAKQIERRRWEERYAAEQDELKALRLAVRTTARQLAPGRPRRDKDKAGYDFHAGRVQSQVSRRVRNAQRRLDELTRTQVRKPPAPLRLRLARRSGAGNRLRDGLAVSLRQVRVPGRLAVDHLDLPATGRLLVVGPNGAGKSTLLAVLARRLAPAGGTVQHRRGLRIGWLEQDVTFPDPSRTPRELYQAPVPLVELGLVAPRDLDRPVGELSVGQRRRLALALVVADPPDLLLLDEPTNHISLTLAEELQQALLTYPKSGASATAPSKAPARQNAPAGAVGGPGNGTAIGPSAVVAASHDRWLRRTWDGPILTVDQGVVQTR